MKTKLTQAQSAALIALVILCYFLIVLGGCAILIKEYS
jgi:hypothetical protein